MKSLNCFSLKNSNSGVQEDHTLKLEERIRHLEEGIRFAAEALDMATSLADLQLNITELRDPAAILNDTRQRIQRLIPFRTLAFYLVREEDLEFHLEQCDPLHMASFVEGEVDNLINLGTFGWALKENRPILFTSQDSREQLILHVITTSSKVSGMFIGVIDHSAVEIPDVSLALLTIILLNTANTLESYQLYKVISDINKELEEKVKERTKQLEYHAVHDPLTELPNRSLIYNRIDYEILASKRRKKNMALLLIDLDRFKDINDNLGHHVGDQLLIEFGARLRRSMRETDTIARLGGDEFAVFLPEISHESDAVEVARRILQCIDEPFALEQWMIDVDASIGVAVFPIHGEDRDTIFRKADMAMYAAKRSKCGYTVYDPTQGDGTFGQLKLMGELRHALDNNSFTLHYQPKVEVRSGRLCGVEALLRWYHPSEGYIPPNVFIPMIERGSLIKILTTKVIQMALHQQRLWLDAGMDIPIAVNLSTMNLQEPDLPENIRSMLSEFRVPASHLEFEITESALMTAPKRTLLVIEKLTQMGIKLAIDDFGTGYSSLAYLKGLPIQIIKIDRSFVANIHRDERDAKIVGSIVDLGHNLGLQVVAEGVELEETRSQLAFLGCDVMQGYFISPALPADELLGWMTSFEKSCVQCS